MFPSNSTVYTDHAAIFNKPFINDVAPNSKLDPPMSFFHFPSTSVDHSEDENLFLRRHHQELLLGHLLPQHHQLLTPNTTSSSTTAAETPIDMAVSGEKSTPAGNHVDRSTNGVCCGPLEKQIRRKRSAKRDRHSKIYTAQGPRDRRMRLSLEIARKFFDLQDMLGFDKASKTVQWLLTKSKGAIRELARGLSQTKHSCSGGTKSVSSTSECEVMSGIEDTTNTGDGDEQGIVVPERKSLGKEKKMKQSRKTKFHPIARESREKARARARERTIEKIWSRRLDESKQCLGLAEANPHKLMSFSPIGAGEEESGGSHSHDMRSSMEVVAEVEGTNSHSLEHMGPTKDCVVDSLVISSKSNNPSSIFNFQQDLAISQGLISNSSNNFPNFSENWDMDSTRTASTHCGTPSSAFLTTSDIRLQSQFGDIQFIVKPWEAYNN